MPRDRQIYVFNWCLLNEWVSEWSCGFQNLGVTFYFCLSFTPHPNQQQVLTILLLKQILNLPLSQSRPPSSQAWITRPSDCRLCFCPCCSIICPHPPLKTLPDFSLLLEWSPVFFPGYRVLHSSLYHSLLHLICFTHSGFLSVPFQLQSLALAVPSSFDRVVSFCFQVECHISARLSLITLRGYYSVSQHHFYLPRRTCLTCKYLDYLPIYLLIDYLTMLYAPFFVVLFTRYLYISV